MVTAGDLLASASISRRRHESGCSDHPPVALPDQHFLARTDAYLSAESGCALGGPDEVSFGPSFNRKGRVHSMAAWPVGYVSALGQKQT